MSGRGAEFAQLAYRILILEERHPLGDVARRMGWDYHVLHARVSNRVVFSADEICRLIAGRGRRTRRPRPAHPGDEADVPGLSGGCR